MNFYHNQFTEATKADPDSLPVATQCPPEGVSGVGFLGTITKSCNKPVNQRLERWAKLSAAREILPGERVSKCLRTISIHKHPDPSRMENFYDLDYFRHVEILKSKENFHYSNLMTCGSVWLCPVCAAKISEQRRSELTQGVLNWKKQGGQVLLLTLTIPHYSNQRLKTVVDGLGHALRRLTNNRGWKSLSQEIGLYGRIRALEVTYGQNGWHPHFHLLLFTYRYNDLEELQAQILELWKDACHRSGLPAPNHHGVKVDNGDMAAQYVGKWGIAHEMTKGHIKKSNQGYSPFDLLSVYIGNSQSGFFLDNETSLAGELFKEYAKVFKGKRQLVWSQGLRESLIQDLADLTDQEAADQIEPDAELFARVDLATWKIILNSNLRGQVLEKCREGKPAFDEYLASLLKLRTSPGEHRDPTHGSHRQPVNTVNY